MREEDKTSLKNYIFSPAISYSCSLVCILLRRVYDTFLNKSPETIQSVWRFEIMGKIVDDCLKMLLMLSIASFSLFLYIVVECIRQDKPPINYVGGALVSLMIIIFCFKELRKE